MKTACIHQPNFIPWLGYFYKIARSDVFIILDNVQYTKNSYINRNKIKTPQGSQWLTIPVNQSGNFGQLISETTISNKSRSLDKIVKTVHLNYKKAKHFENLFEEFCENVLEEPDKIVELNVNLIKWVMEITGIKTEVVFSSHIKIPGASGTERLIALCKYVGADRYFSGFGGMNYQEEESFRKEGIEVKVTDFNHPEYDQLWGDFEANLSIIDLIFNCGPESGTILLKDQ